MPRSGGIVCLQRNECSADDHSHSFGVCSQEKKNRKDKAQISRLISRSKYELVPMRLERTPLQRRSRPGSSDTKLDLALVCSSVRFKLIVPAQGLSSANINSQLSILCEVITTFILRHSQRTGLFLSAILAGIERCGPSTS